MNEPTQSDCLIVNQTEVGSISVCLVFVPCGGWDVTVSWDSGRITKSRSGTYLEALDKYTDTYKRYLN